MSLRLKRNEYGPPAGSRGSTMPIVLFFAAIGLTAVLSYFLHQLTFAKPSLRAPASYQALLNARSGVYKALETYFSNDKEISDTLKTISTLDSMFGSDLIEIKDTTLIELSSEPQPLELFDSDSFGKCEIALIPHGIFYVMESTGEYRDFRRKVKAVLGSKIPALPDTVLILLNENPWEGQEPDGKRVQMKDTVAAGTSDLLSKLLSEYQTQLQITDTSLYDPPLVIQSNIDLAKIPDIVNGPLLIDGSYVDIKWESDRRITVMDDLQFTGEVKVTGISFIAGGEIKILDKSDLSEVSLFSNSRIFIGDNARFRGDALATQNITVYGRAEVLDKSTLVCTGGGSSTSSTSDSSSFSITVAEEAKVDGTCMALSSPGSIKTEKDVYITGILWARDRVCHLGKMKGIIRAVRVIDCEGDARPLTGGSADTAPAEGNALPGKLSVLENITDYKMPYYSGLPSILKWEED